jgi:hypothetical protein
MNKRIWQLALLFFLLHSKLLAQVNLENPKPNAILFNSNVELEWSSNPFLPAATSFTVQLSQDPDFSNLTSFMSSSSVRDTLSLSSPSKYYWRVIRSNSTGSDTSASGNFIYSDLRSLTNIRLLFITDSSVVNASNELGLWRNLADPTLDAVDKIS